MTAAEYAAASGGILKNFHSVVNYIAVPNRPLIMNGPQTITVIAANVVSILTATHVLTVYQPRVADFMATPVSGTVPLTVSFTNLSSGPFTQSLWTFGDGFTSTVTSPSHAYTVPGTYTTRSL